MMPYIVTVKTPAPKPWDGVVESVSRRAVATLEDPPNSVELGVRGLLYAMIPEESTAHEHDHLYEQIDAIGESGGTVGPLSDGTVIEVERVDWRELAIGDPAYVCWSDAEILDAFNAREASA